MPVVEETITIRAPIDQVFAQLTDPRRAVEWNPNIVQISDVSDIPIREGSSWRQVVLVAGRPITLQCRVVRWQPPHHGAIQVVGDQKGRVWTTCRELDGRARVTEGIDFVPPGGRFGGLLGQTITPLVRRELSQTMQRQRAVLERELGGSMHELA